MSIATLLSQHHQVTAVDIIPEKVDMINNRKSPIQDDYIEKYLAEKELNLDKFDITVICVVPSYLGTIEDKYKTQKYYELLAYRMLMLLL